MKTQEGWEITGGRIEDGRVTYDVSVPLRTLPVTVYVPTAECCWLPRSATSELNKPGMSHGDQRAWMDRFGCKAKATWEIHFPDDPYFIVESCDAHKADLMDDDSTARPLGPL